MNNARQNQSSESIIREIRQNTRREYSTEEKIRIILEGLKGEVSLAELCRREGIVNNLYYCRSREFSEADKKRLAGDTARKATWPPYYLHANYASISISQIPVSAANGNCAGSRVVIWQDTANERYNHSLSVV
jgi:hypothetical protein